MSVNKVVVTGTKGKTTVVNIMADVLLKIGYDRVLHVNTLGHFVNGEQKSTDSDSKENWGLVPTVCPGRYLYEFIGHPKNDKAVAVLEASLGSSSSAGLGYALHQVGIFLNVFEDHIGNSKRINSQLDIVEAKKFVLNKIKSRGVAVMNLDDELVMSALDNVSFKKGIKLCLFSLHHSTQSLPEELQHAGLVTVVDKRVVYFDPNTKKGVDIVELEDVTWTFNGCYDPSLYNLLAVVSGIISLHGSVPDNLCDALKNSKLNPYGGRLTRLVSANGVNIIADYAHEKKSLVEIARLARRLNGPQSKVIGVVRLAYDRAEELIIDTGKAIAPEFDHLVVYDKIDGFWRSPKDAEKQKFDRFKQEVGKISSVFSDAIKTVNPNCERILREDEAIAYAATIAEPGDTVVIIVNDNIKRSIDFILEHFNAKFV